MTLGGLFIFTASNAMLNSAIENFNGFGAFTTIGGTCMCMCVTARGCLTFRLPNHFTCASPAYLG